MFNDKPIVSSIPVLRTISEQLLCPYYILSTYFENKLSGHTTYNTYDLPGIGICSKGRDYFPVSSSSVY